MIVCWAGFIENLLYILFFKGYIQKPNSWTYSFVEVNVHNVQTSDFSMDFLNQTDGDMVFYPFPS
jgi:hypothetical protein